MYNFNADIIIFRDTEYTSWEGAMENNRSQPGQFKEIVQIGAVKVNTKRWEEIDSFSIFIKPKLNPILSDFFKNLTHITQEQVDQGKDFLTAIKEFESRTQGYDMYSFGRDELEVKENYGFNKTPMGFINTNFFDARDIFNSFEIDAKKYTSGTINQAVGILNKETKHNALSDARNIFNSTRKLYN